MKKNIRVFLSKNFSFWRWTFLYTWISVFSKWNLPLHHYILHYLMIPLADSKGPEQIARMRRLIWTFAVCIWSEYTFPHGTAHFGKAIQQREVLPHTSSIMRNCTTWHEWQVQENKTCNKKREQNGENSRTAGNYNAEVTEERIRIRLSIWKQTTEVYVLELWPFPPWRPIHIPLQTVQIQMRRLVGAVSSWSKLFAFFCLVITLFAILFWMFV